MKLALLGLVKKIMEVLFITFISFTGYQEKSYTVKNTNKDKSLDLITEVLTYETETRYNSELAKGKTNVLQSGKNGYVIINEDTKEKMTEKAAINEIIEIGTYVTPAIKQEEKTVTTVSTTDSFVGKLTMYYNCPNSSICKTNTGYDLKKSVYYEDKTYGTVRVLSAAQAKFKAGSIIEIVYSGQNLYGIVLDTGGDMISAWKNVNVHIDLAIDAATEKAYTVNNVTFNVKRYGW